MHVRTHAHAQAQKDELAEAMAARAAAAIAAREAAAEARDSALSLAPPAHAAAAHAGAQVGLAHCVHD